jgi:hypothetical protein
MAVQQNGDLYRLLFDFDVKGDTCGRTNDQLPNIPQSGCVPDSAQKTSKVIFQETGGKTLMEDLIADISASWREIIYMCLVALGKLSLTLEGYTYIKGYLYPISYPKIGKKDILLSFFEWDMLKDIIS